MIEYESIGTIDPVRRLSVDTSGELMVCLWVHGGNSDDDENLVMLNGDQAAALAATLNRFADRVAAKEHAR